MIFTGCTRTRLCTGSACSAGVTEFCKCLLSRSAILFIITVFGTAQTNAGEIMIRQDGTRNDRTAIVRVASWLCRDSGDTEDKKDKKEKHHFFCVTIKSCYASKIYWSTGGLILVTFIGSCLELGFLVLKEYLWCETFYQSLREGKERASGACVLSFHD